MIEVSHLVLLIVGELLLLTTIAVVIFTINVVAKRSHDRAAAKKLVALIKKDEERREAETLAVLTERFGLEGAAADSISRSIGREERLFYQTLIKVYLQRDYAALQNMNVHFESAVAPYRSLELPPSADQSADDHQEQASDGEVKRLRDENERLSEELRVTMDTLGRMLNEYSAIYSGGAEAIEKHSETPVAPSAVADEPDQEDEVFEELPNNENDETEVGVFTEETDGDEGTASNDTASGQDDVLKDDVDSQGDELDDGISDLDDVFGDALDLDEGDTR